MEAAKKTSAKPMAPNSSKKSKHSGLIPAVVSLLAVVAFLSVWYIAVR